MVEDRTVSYVYQMTITRPDNEKKVFATERDLIFSEIKITKQKLHDISKQFKADVTVSYLGALVSPSEDEIMDYRVDYHTKKMLKAIRKEWKEEDGKKDTKSI